ncbi:Protein of unknown function DUF2009 [Nannochloropsis gaditana]|uniref:B box-type domain-containing protein n=1 Tax=Nannochloropsis gaditana TaxID=72520 RepID=W7TKN4_9STRA|nr:Protein of unknown function DUF2009 [Nannochloropsis gaditana]
MDDRVTDEAPSSMNGYFPPQEPSKAQSARCQGPPAAPVDLPPASSSSCPSSSTSPPVFCIECEDQTAEVTCLGCEEDFCRPCWLFQHRRGKRAEHRVQALLGDVMAPPQVPAEEREGEGAVGTGEAGGREDGEEEAVADMMVGEEEGEEEEGPGFGAGGGSVRVEGPPEDTAVPPDWVDRYEEEVSQAQAFLCRPAAQKMLWDRAEVTPLRLTARERRLLGVLESALNVSTYTDHVDALGRRATRQSRMVEELERVFATILGLMICADPARGRALVVHPIAEHGDFFREIFEVGRRYKVMNPEKLRGTHGKLMYMLQDAQGRSLQAQIGFGSCVKPLATVGALLKDRAQEGFLQDARVLLASRDVSARRGERGRAEARREAWMKRRAARELQVEWGTGELSSDDVQRLLDSMADANNYLNFNVRPVKRVLRQLQDNFAVDEVEEGFSLAIGGGKPGRRESGGAGPKLSHDHATHYTYVWQSLRLWREVMQSMFRLWFLADQDLLSPPGPSSPSSSFPSYSSSPSYTLLNTGQGLNRVQACPAVGAEMRSILQRVQRECGAWVGLSVVHLGDRDVPNALMFIDKYTQVPRILSPIAKVIEECLLASVYGKREEEEEEGVPDEDEEGGEDGGEGDPEEGGKQRGRRGMGADALYNQALAAYAKDVWGSAGNLKMHVLTDFFRRAFDGDGDDGGSCIDGRLTSAWNWCSKIAKKPYYHAFLLAGFTGFDGDWGRED